MIAASGKTEAWASAIAWISELVQGSLGTSLAVLAIAACGIGMLFGEVSVRRGAQTILGCFILFGAPTIAAGLMGIVRDAQPPASQVQAPPPPVNVPPSPPPNLDPYAGASVPM